MILLWVLLRNKNMKEFIGKYPFIVIILLVLLIITTIALIRAIQTINELEVIEPILYTETEGKVQVILPSGVTATLSFGEKCVSIEPSAGTTRKDACFLARFIKGYSKKAGISIRAPTIALIGEYRLHSISSSMGFEKHRSEKADIDYNGDSRTYVNITSHIVGILGI